MGGGITLARSPVEINIGDVIKKTEGGFVIVECFDTANNSCSISSSCKLKKIISNATKAFIDELSQYTLADLVVNKSQILVLLTQSPNSHPEVIG